jgi:hypothetical protein
MTQLEQELTALFEDAAARVEIRPQPVRSPRAVALNRALAAGVTAALVAALALIATRLGADSADRGGSVTPAATQQLLDAVARTLGQPLRVEITFDSGQGAAQTTVTEEDLDRQELVSYQEGQPQLLIHGNHVYQGIGAAEHQMFKLPASAQWVEVPSSASGRSAAAMLDSFAGVVSPQQLANALGSGRVSVTEVAEGTFRLSGPQSAPPGLTGPDVETIHITADGLLNWARIRMDNVPSSPQGHLVMTARITPLGHPITVPVPDPGTVISQKAYDAATNFGQTCTGTSSPSPAPNGSVVQCSISVGGTTTLPAVKAHPKRH